MGCFNWKSRLLFSFPYQSGSIIPLVPGHPGMVVLVFHHRKGNHKELTYCTSLYLNPESAPRCLPYTIWWELPLMAFHPTPTQREGKYKVEICYWNQSMKDKEILSESVRVTFVRTAPLVLCIWQCTQCYDV